MEKDGHRSGAGEKHGMPDGEHVDVWQFGMISSHPPHQPDWQFRCAPLPAGYVCVIAIVINIHALKQEIGHGS
jgi:hypothetical protein